MVFAISFSMTIRKLLRPVLESSFEMLSFDIWVSSVAIQLFELWRFIKKLYLGKIKFKKMKKIWWETQAGRNLIADYESLSQELSNDI